VPVPTGPDNARLKVSTGSDIASSTRVISNLRRLFPPVTASCLVALPNPSARPRPRHLPHARQLSSTQTVASSGEPRDVRDTHERFEPDFALAAANWTAHCRSHLQISTVSTSRGQFHRSARVS
jgi:hypothetical protein